MKRLLRGKSKVLGIALIAALALAAVGINAGQQPKKVRVLYTTDTMGYLEPCG